jgi:predicted ATPase/DNA-binding XRE family transcriptional regulator/tetratricopeptide (TPR) repeat protein
MQEFETFGQWLKQQRRSQDYTQSALAERINCAVVTLRKIESDDLRPSHQMVQRILDELQVPPAAQTGLLALACNEQIGQRSNLPTPLSRLIGRDYELERAVQSLRNGTRLLNIIGSPGVGKSRLSIQIASQALSSFANGCYYLDLTACKQPEDFLIALAELLHIELSANKDQLSTIVQALDGSHMLLLLDNINYALGISPLLSQLLQRLPRLCILTSSRMRLAIAGKQVLHLPPLALPSQEQLEMNASFELVRHVPAVALFNEHAQIHSDQFELTERNIHTVVNICMQLDGNPLAIELAAAWVKIFSLPKLLQRLKGSLNLLSQDSSVQQLARPNMRELIAETYQQLEADEQELLQALALFQHGSTLEAAIAMVADANDSQASDQVATKLAHLLDYNLLYQQTQREQEPRFFIYETIRIFALEQLDLREKRAEFQQKQSIYFLGLAEQSRSELNGSHQTAVLVQLRQEAANLQSLLIRESSPAGDPHLVLQLCSALWRAWYILDYVHEGKQWLTIALDLNCDQLSATRSDVLCGAAYFAYYTGDEPQAKHYLEQTIAACAQLELGPLEAEALVLMGLLAAERYSIDLAQNYYLKALQVLERHPHPQTEVWALVCLGQLYRLSEQPALYASYSRNSVMLCRRLGDNFALGQALLLYAKLLLNEHSFAQAGLALAEALNRFQDVDHQLGEGLCYLGLLNLSLQQNQLAQAENALELARACFRKQARSKENAWLNFRAGQLAQLTGDYQTAQAAYQSVLDDCPQHGQRDLRAYGHYQLAQLAMIQGDSALASAEFHNAALLMQSMSMPSLSERSRALSELVAHLPDRQDAISHLATLLAHYRLIENRPGIAQCQRFLAELWLRQDEHSAAQDAIFESAAILVGLNDQMGMVSCLSDLALIALYNSQTSQAAQLYGLSKALEEALGSGEQQLYFIPFELEWNRKKQQILQQHLQNDITKIWLKLRNLPLPELQAKIEESIGSLGIMREVSY